MLNVYIGHWRKGLILVLGVFGKESELEVLWVWVIARTKKRRCSLVFCSLDMCGSSGYGVARAVPGVRKKLKSWYLRARDQ